MGVKMKNLGSNAQFWGSRKTYLSEKCMYKSLVRFKCVSFSFNPHVGITTCSMNSEKKHPVLVVLHEVGGWRQQVVCWTTFISLSPSVCHFLSCLSVCLSLYACQSASISLPPSVCLYVSLSRFIRDAIFHENFCFKSAITDEMTFDKNNVWNPSVFTVLPL